jgi:hypothetical protein
MHLVFFSWCTNLKNLRNKLTNFQFSVRTHNFIVQWNLGCKALLCAITIFWHSNTPVTVSGRCFSGSLNQYALCNMVVANKSCFTFLQFLSIQEATGLIFIASIICLEDYIKIEDVVWTFSSLILGSASSSSGSNMDSARLSTVRPCVKWSNIGLRLALSLIASIYSRNCIFKK